MSGRLRKCGINRQEIRKREDRWINEAPREPLPQDTRAMQPIQMDTIGGQAMHFYNFQAALVFFVNTHYKREISAVVS